MSSCSKYSLLTSYKTIIIFFNANNDINNLGINSLDLISIGKNNNFFIYIFF